MKNSLCKLINDNTSGFPFILWVIGGLSLAVFLAFFRNYPGVDFHKIEYVLAISAVWIVLSDIFKKKEVINKHLHFIIDSMAYFAIYGLIIHFTGGFQGDLFFLFLLATVSAPIFANVVETVLFLIFLSIFTFLVYFSDPQFVDTYHTGVIAIQIVFYFVIGGTLKYFFERLSRSEMEKRAIVENKVKECKAEVQNKTQELVKTITQLGNANAQLSSAQSELKNKIAELERFNNLAVDRELKMVELKNELKKLKDGVKNP